MKEWPWPDTPEDAAKRVAQSYRHLAARIISGATDDPRATLEGLDERWVELGAGWVRPTDVPLPLDDWLTSKEIAELFYVTAKRVYMWGRRGHVEFTTGGDGQKRYRVQDVVDLQASRVRGNR